MSRRKTSHDNERRVAGAKKTGAVLSASKAAVKLTDLLASSSGTHRDSQGTPSPGRGAIERLSAIPLLFDAPTGARAYRGGVVLDSWSSGGAVALRDLVAGHTRRLQLCAGPIELDLVAERRAGDWQFTARAKTSGSVAHGFALRVDTRKLLPRAGGFYRWSSRSVPRSLELLSFDMHVVFERLAWE